MSDESIPVWFTLLNALLVQDQHLDQLEKDRLEKDKDPEKSPRTVSRGHRWRVDTLSRLWSKNNCPRYATWLQEGGACPVPDPEPEIEKAALHALLEWLKPAPYYPAYTTPNEQKELRDLRDSLARAAKERLQQLEVRPPGPFGDLQAFAATRLKGIERRVVELVCSKGGICPLADVAADSAIQWNVPYDDAWNNTRKRINGKLKAAGLPWKLSRYDNQAKLIDMPCKSRPK